MTASIDFDSLLEESHDDPRQQECRRGTTRVGWAAGPRGRTARAASGVKVAPGNTLVATDTRPALEPKAIDLLKAASSRLAAAGSMASQRPSPMRARAASAHRSLIRLNPRSSYSGPTSCG